MSDNQVIKKSWTEPISILIKKIADAIGVVFEPTRILRKVKAEAEAKIIMAKADLEIKDFDEQAQFHRAMKRFIYEEKEKQNNIENIIEKALPNINENAPTNKIEKDWITHFFDKAKLVSDEEMQIMWSKILSGEANEPGNFSKKTLNIVSEIDKYSAKLFTNLCSFSATAISKYPTPFVYSFNSDIYNKYNISFITLVHLDDLGLINFDSSNGFKFDKLNKTSLIDYFGKKLVVEFPMEEKNNLMLGFTIFTFAGSELLAICNAKPNDEILDYLITEWEKQGIKVVNTGKI